MTKPTSSQSRSETRLAQVLDEYLAAAQHGAPFDRSAFLAAHAELGEDLEACLASLDFLRTASPVDLGGNGPPNDQLADFRIVRELGRGGMGVVYEAHQPSLDRRVALKVLLAGRFAPAGELRRFRIEAEAAAQLDHPNIVPIYEVGEHAGLPFFSMKLLDGGSLSDRIADSGSEPAESAIRPEEAGRLVASIARAVHHAHQRGILHRDLKPSNILLTADGEPHITDFGLARRVAADSTLTQTGDLLGSPAYMAPEQASGKRSTITVATDVYGLGAILYTLLTRQPPFSGDSALETLARVKEAPPAPPSRLSPKLDRDLETICLKCLEKDPTQRYSSAETLADDLERWLRGEPIARTRPSRWYRLRTFARRHRVILTTTGLVALALVTGTAVSLWQAVVARRAQAEAVTQRDRARKAVDEMYTQVAEKWLAKQPRLERIQRDFLEKALRLYEEFATESQADPQTTEQSALAFSRVGKIRTALGNHAGAEAAYLRALEIGKRLTAEFPENARYHINVAQDYCNLGDLLKRTGRRKEGEQTFRLALRQVEEGPIVFLNTSPKRRVAAAAYEDLGLLLTEAGRNEEAASAFGRAIPLYEKLATESPPLPMIHENLANALNSQGNLFLFTGRLSEAEIAYRRALAASPEPDDRKPAYFYINLSTALWRMRRNGEAAKVLSGAIISARKRSEEFPSTPEYRYDLATAQGNLGVLLGTLNRLKEAEQSYRDAIAVEEALTKDFPPVSDYKELLGEGWFNLGILVGTQKRWPEAEAAFLRSRELFQQLVAQNPDVPRYRESLADACLNGGKTYLVTSRWNEAVTSLEKWKELAAAHNPRDLLHLATAYLHKGETLESRRCYDAALAEAAKRPKDPAFERDRSELERLMIVGSEKFPAGEEAFARDP